MQRRILYEKKSAVSKAQDSPSTDGAKIYQGRVEKLVYSGDGLIRTLPNGESPHGVIFIPYTAPQELVQFQITTSKKRFSRARLLKVIEPSSDRVEPKCPHFGACGGCQLQHISPSRHGAIKRQWLEEALLPLDREVQSKTDWVSLDPIWQWRRKITLHVKRENGDWQLGYWGMKDGGLSFIPIHACPIFFFDEEKSLLQDIRRCVRDIFSSPKFLSGTISIDISLIRISHIEHKGRFGIHFSFTSKQHAAWITAAYEEKLAAFLRQCSWADQASYAEHVESSIKPTRRKNLFGNPYTYFTVGSIECKAPFHAFMQNHPHMCYKIWSDVVEYALTVFGIRKGMTAIDLYSGIGATALLLSQAEISVYAAEISKSAVQALLETAESAKLQMYLKAFSLSVEEALCRAKEPFNSELARAGREPYLWLSNPPRTGMSREVVESLASGSCGEKGIYTSCDPATLARDLRVLLSRGWKIEKVRGYDMFPMTTHFETVVCVSA